MFEQEVKCTGCTRPLCTLDSTKVLEQTVPFGTVNVLLFFFIDTIRLLSSQQTTCNSKQLIEFNINEIRPTDTVFNRLCGYMDCNQNF